MSGASSGRRAVFRWAWRLFRREWRQQIRVLALLTVAIAVTVVGMSAGYNLAPVRGNAEFGTASRLLTLFNVPDSESVEVVAADAEAHFGTIELITRRDVEVPGTIGSIEIRGQNPHGEFSDPMLALLDGRYPDGADEVAVTDSVAEAFGLDLGSSFKLGDDAWTVVGLVENPSDLGDEFALVIPSQDEFPQSVTILVDASRDRVDSFFETPIEIQFEGNLIGGRPTAEVGASIVLVLVISVVMLLLVSLVAAAGFVAVAQRRLRQLGMLAAIGATEGHLRFVMIANGAVIGVLSALLGVAFGALAWVLAAPWIESAVGHRIDRFNVPWWLQAVAMALAILTAIAAAWWPARSAARVSVVRALSGRPPTSQTVHRSSVLAGLLILAGVSMLVWADPSKVIEETSDSPIADPFNATLIATGTLATMAGVLFAGPLVIRALAATARWLPVAIRLALRDLVRFQSRSAAALAAISLTLGIALTVVVAAAAAEPQSDEGNLSDRQLLVWTRDPDEIAPIPADLTAAELERLETDMESIAAMFDDPSVIALDVAVFPAVVLNSGDRIPQLPVALYTERDDGEVDYAADTYIAESDILEFYGVDLDRIPAETELLTAEAGDVLIRGEADPAAGRPEFEFEAVSNVLRLDPSYSSIPGTFIVPGTLQRIGAESERAGWFIQTDSAITSEQLDQARQMAADSGLLEVEIRSGGGNLVAMRWPATAAGLLVALSILAMTVGLIRGEATGDLRTLAATGATGSIRRTLTAFTAGALALLGALIGGAGAYLVIASLYSRDLVELSQVPVPQLIVIIVGVPLAATAAGWLLAGREPATLARPAIE